MPATSAIDLRAMTDPSARPRGGHKLPSHQLERPEKHGFNVRGAATGQRGREVDAEQHALPPEDAEGHRQHGLRLLEELLVGVEKVGGAVSLQEGHR